MKNKQKNIANYLENKPRRLEGLQWSSNETGNVTIEIKNKGLFNKIAQKLLKKPKISYIHLDEMGSFIWPLLDGDKTILVLGEAVEAHFGEKAQPLYERLAKYMQILDSYHFIEFN